VDATLGKSNHCTTLRGDVKAQVYKIKSKPKGRLFGRMGNIKKEEILAYHVCEESREEMDVEKPKCCNEDQY